MKFKIGDASYIELDFLRPLNKLESYDCYSVIISCSGNEYQLLDNYGYPTAALFRFDYLLGRAISGKLELHESIQEDIGYTENEESRAFAEEADRGKFAYDTQEDGAQWWVGYRYRLWHNTPASQTSWFYSRQGNFFLALTPEYRWLFCEPEADDDFVPYEEFMKHYKPIFIVKIPREALVRWKRQTDRLMRVVESNEKRIRANFFANRRTWRLRRLARLKRAVR